MLPFIFYACETSIILKEEHNYLFAVCSAFATASIPAKGLIHPHILSVRELFPRAKQPKLEADQ
jgi:hypothetical protein